MLRIGQQDALIELLGFRQQPGAVKGDTLVEDGVVLGGVFGVTAGVAATVTSAAIVFLWKRPFAAADVELVGKLDMPGPFKRLTLRALARLG